MMKLANLVLIHFKLYVRLPLVKLKTKRYGLSPICKYVIVVTGNLSRYLVKYLLHNRDLTKDL